jgi:hypothetical protein
MKLFHQSELEQGLALEFQRILESNIRSHVNIYLRTQYYDFLTHPGSWRPL